MHPQGSELRRPSDSSKAGAVHQNDDKAAPADHARYREAHRAACRSKDSAGGHTCMFFIAASWPDRRTTPGIIETLKNSLNDSPLAPPGRTIQLHSEPTTKEWLENLDITQARRLARHWSREDKAQGIPPDTRKAKQNIVVLVGIRRVQAGRTDIDYFDALDAERHISGLHGTQQAAAAALLSGWEESTRQAIGQITPRAWFTWPLDRWATLEALAGTRRANRYGITGKNNGERGRK